MDAGGRVWLLDWDAGETISNELSRRVDLAQTLALVAAGAGVERAIASASRSIIFLGMVLYFVGAAARSHRVYRAFVIAVDRKSTL